MARTKRRWGLVLAGVFALLVVGLVVAGFALRGRAATLVREQLDRYLDADVAVGGVDVSLLRSFPLLLIEVEDLAVTGRGDFVGEPLLKTPVIKLGVALFSFFDDGPVQVDSIHIERPALRLRVLDDGRGNYDIVKDTGDSEGSAEFAVAAYSIEEGSLTYQSPDLQVQVGELALRGSADIKQQTYTVPFESELAGVSVTSEGAALVEDARIALKADAVYDGDTKTLALGQSTLEYNEIPLNVAGQVVLAGDFPDLDLQVGLAKAASVKALLSALPATLRRRDVKAGGALAFDARIKGPLKGDGDLPAIDANLKVSDGRLQYAKMPRAIDAVSLEGTLAHPGGSLDRLRVHLKRYAVRVGQSSAAGSLLLIKPISGPDVELSVKGDVDLAELADAFPLEGVQTLNGKVKADIDAAGTPRAVRRLGGEISAHDVHYQATNQPAIGVAQAQLNLTPQSTQIKRLTGTVGESDFAIYGSLSPLLTLLQDGAPIEGKLAFASSRLDVDTFLSSEKGDETAFRIPDDVDLSVQAKVGALHYGQVTVSEARALVTVKDSTLSLQGGRGQVLGGQIEVDGEVSTPAQGEPVFELRYGLQNAKFERAREALNTMSQLAPIMKFLDGSFDSALAISGKLGADSVPEIHTLKASGFLNAINSRLHNFKPLTLLAQAVPAVPDSFSLKRVKAHFRVEEGKVLVKDFPFKIKGQSFVLGGSHGLDQQMAYVLRTQVPLQQLKNTALLGKLQRSGFDLGGVGPVDLVVNISGSLKDPQLAFDVGTDSLKNAAKQALEAQLKAQQDKLRAEEQKLRDEEAKLRAKVFAEADAVLAQARKQVEQVREQARAAGAKLKKEGYARASQLEKEGQGNPLKALAAKQAADAVRKETDNRVKQLVGAADKRADEIMQQAERKAAKMKANVPAPPAL